MNNLHPIAQAVQSQGRGKDTQLVHMTPNEVQGLHALAKAHGGSLSINPSTGLPEAGFLDSMLPTILGVGLAAATGGTSLAFINPATIGLGIGALQYARTGSLEKGLMAGLGAYGGAGMAGSLGLGAAASAAPANSAITAAKAGTQAVNAGYGLGASTAGQGATLGSSGMSLSGSAIPSQTSLYSLNPASQFSLAPGASGSAASGITAAPFTPPPVTPMPTVPAAPASIMDKLGSTEFWKDNWKSAAAAAAPTAMDMMTPEGTTAPADNEQFQYTYDPGRASEEDLDAQRAAYAARGITGGELKFFRPKYGPRQTVQVAQGGEIGYADGGTSDYEYDPASQTYKKVVQAPTGAVDPIGINGSDRTGDSSNDNQPLSQQTIDFLDKEEDTLGARDARMGKINDFVTQIGKMSIVGAIARGLFGGKSEAAPAAVADQAQAQGYLAAQGLDSDSGGFTGADAGGGGFGPSAPGGMAQGGLLSLAAGGMSKGGFVVPADVVSALGNGSSDAGLRKLYALIGDVKPIKGKGDGLSDSIPTSIDGRQPARVADGEAYVNPKTVAKIGGGDAKKGAKKLYAMMDKIRQQAHGKKTQQREVNAKAVV
jgi:hypothetical protein